MRPGSGGVIGDGRHLRVVSGGGKRVSGSRPGRNRVPYKIIMLGLLISAGVILHLLGWFDWRRFIELGEEYAHTWWFAPAIIMVKMVLYTFALPGSVMFWVAGLFYDPIPATAVIVAGGVGGATTAYFFARSISGEDAGRVETTRLFSLMRKNTDLATLCAVRTLPNFPHTVINYGAAILNVPLPRFIISTLVGFTIKGYLYSSMIRRAATADGFSGIIDLRTIGSLLIVAALFMAGKAFQQFNSTDGHE